MPQAALHEGRIAYGPEENTLGHWINRLWSPRPMSAAALDLLRLYGNKCSHDKRDGHQGGGGGSIVAILTEEGFPRERIDSFGHDMLLVMGRVAKYACDQFDMEARRPRFRDA